MTQPKKQVNETEIIGKNQELVIYRSAHNVEVWHEDGITHHLSLPLDATEREIRIALDAFRAGQFDVRCRIRESLTDVLDLPPIF